MSDLNLLLENVFVTDAYPEHTYVSADSGEFERLLKEGLAIANKIISIVGPSKCGKTTLCDRVFGTTNGVSKYLCTGDSIDSADDFWRLIFNKTPAASDYGDLVPSRETILEILAHDEIPIIIDDFHYIAPEIQRRLCQQLKNAAARGIRFIILNTPHKTDEPIRNNPDLAGRFFAIDANFWSQNNLQEIGRTGFGKLGVEIDESILHKLSIESLGSPQLMQTLCLETGREYLQKDIPYEHQKIDLKRFSWRNVQMRAVRSYDYRSAYQKLKVGPALRGKERTIYEFKNSSNGNVYDLIALILATDPSFDSLMIQDIRERSKQILSEDVTPNFPAALEQISNLFPRGTELEYDVDNRRLTILDPHFHFYLRTKVLVNTSDVEWG